MRRLPFYIIVMIPCTLALLFGAVLVNNMADMHTNRSVLQTEQKGIVLHYEMLGLVKLLQEHRGKEFAYLNGEKRFQKELISGKKSISEQLARVDPLFVHFPALEERWKDTKGTVGDLDPISYTLHPVESFDLHSSMIATLLSLMKCISDRSRMSENMPLEHYYFQLINNEIIPFVTEDIGQARGLASGYVANNTRLSESQKERLLYLYAGTMNFRTKLNQSYSFMVKQSEVKQQSYMHLVSHIDRYTRTFDDQLLTVVRGQNISFTSYDFFENGTSAIIAYHLLYEYNKFALEDLVKVKLKFIHTKILFIVFIGLFYTILFILSMVLLYNWRFGAAHRKRNNNIDLKSMLENVDNI